MLHAIRVNHTEICCKGGREDERWQGNLRRRDPPLYPDLARALRHRQARVGDLRWIVGPDHTQPGPEPLRRRLRASTLAQSFLASRGGSMLLIDLTKQHLPVRTAEYCR